MGLSKAPLPSGAAAAAGAAGRASPLVSNNPEASYSDCPLLLLSVFPVYMPDQRSSRTVARVAATQPDDFAEKEQSLAFLQHNRSTRLKGTAEPSKMKARLLPVRHASYCTKSASAISSKSFSLFHPLSAVFSLFQPFSASFSLLSLFQPHEASQVVGKQGLVSG